MNRRELLKNSATTIMGLGLIPGMATFMQGCKPDQVSQSATFLNSTLYSDLEAITDTMLPRTETPGAVDAGVAQFIDSLFTGYFDQSQQEMMQDGLDTLHTSCKSETGQYYHELELDEKKAFLTDQFKSNEFMQTLKSLITWGYFTSETGMKAMNYQPVPGKYEGCIPNTDKLVVGNRT